LAVGLNDAARIGRPDGRQQLAPEAFLFGLQQLLRDARQLEPVFVLGLTPVLEEAMPWAEVLWYSMADVGLYEGLLEEACMEADVPFLPLLAPFLEEPHWQRWLSADGLHCNSEGHEFLFERVRRWPPLLAWAGLHLQEVATPQPW
jgi:lysophospholipase L1-like esterase